MQRRATAATVIAQSVLRGYSTAERHWSRRAPAFACGFRGVHKSTSVWMTQRALCSFETLRAGQGAEKALYPASVQKRLHAPRGGWREAI